MIADHVAGILTEEALDTFAELLGALNVDLLHTGLTWGYISRVGVGRNLHSLLVIEGDIGDEILDYWEGAKWGDGDYLALLVGRDLGHTGQAWLSIDLHGA